MIQQKGTSTRYQSPVVFDQHRRSEIGILSFPDYRKNRSDMFSIPSNSAQLDLDCAWKGAMNGAIVVPRFLS